MIREYFHMHEVGVAGAQEQYRDGTLLRKSQVNFWDFEQTGMYSPRQRPFQVQEIPFALLASITPQGKMLRSDWRAIRKCVRAI